MSEMHARITLRVESLECRILLSTAAVSHNDGLTPSQLTSLYSAGKLELHGKLNTPGTSKSGSFSKLSTDLQTLYQLNPTGGGLSPQQFGIIESKNGAPAISVHTRGNVLTLLHRLDKLGITVTGVDARSHLVDGYLPISSLALAASLPHVTGITAIDKLTVNSVGSAPDQADQVENVAAARAAFGATGAGVKVGVISDSVNQVGNGLADSIKSGDLPNNVHVLKDGQPNDTDEGRAILEEIHDLAPGASLYFYSGDGPQDMMITAINALKAAGCKIIVDDLGYSNEPMFQDGVISKAINSFVSAGGSYFSAIGNDGNSGYLRTNVQYTKNSNGTTWVNWAGNGLASGEDLNFTTNGPVNITLEWSNPYNGDTGSATSDLDVFIYNASGTQLITSSTDDNLTTGLPIEQIPYTLNNGSYQMRVQLAAMEPGAKPPTMIKFVASEVADGGLTTINYPGILSSAYGHGAGEETISVGAVEFASAPPFSSMTPINSEDYSSTGPIIYAFDANGNALSTPLILDKPDVSGVDGVNTSFFGEVTPDDPTSLPQFYGTSAAAPNVAAIAALIDQLHPTATEEQILAALKASTTPLNGATSGAWDPQGGYGLVNATRAMDYFGTTPVAPTVKIATVATPRTTSITSEAVAFNEAVSGISLSNFTLTRNGGANLLTSAQTLTTADQTAFTLGNLSALTSAPGTYVLTLSPSGITGEGLALAGGASTTWTTHSAAVAPTVALGAVSTPRTSSVATETITFNEPVSGFTLTSLSLTRNGGANLLSSAQTLTSTDETNFILANLSALTSVAGSYVLSLSAGGITGDGIALSAGASTSWLTNMTAVAPTADLVTITTPRATPVTSEAISFNEPVTGFTMANLTLTRDNGANLLTSAQTLTSADRTNFTIGNLSSLTTAAGSYNLKLTPTGITGDGLALTADTSISWTTTAGDSAAAVVLAPISTPQTTAVGSETITFNQAATGFKLADLSLTRNGGPNLLTASQTVVSSNQTTFTLGNLSTLTTLAGNYTLTLKSAGITSGGAALATGATLSWKTNSTVAGRHLFYNDSVYDDYTAAANASDDAAIATDKTALLPGETATYANISNYYHGINGIMIDVSGLPVAKLSAADFTFKTGNNNAPSTWATGPAPASILVRPGAGVNGSARIELVWPMHNGSASSAIIGKWLRVTLKADADTGLAAADVFYFGSAVGDVGVSTSTAAVTSADIAAIKAQVSTATVSVTSNYDITRNGIVNADDAIIAAEHKTSGLAVLAFIEPK